MENRQRRETLNGLSQAHPAKRQTYVLLMILLLLTAGVFAGMACLILHEKHAKARSGGSPAKLESGALTGAKAEFESLKGRWVRPDGGYVVEIRGIDAHGKMLAAYFNPRPIKVFRGAASEESAAINTEFLSKGGKYAETI